MEVGDVVSNIGLGQIRCGTTSARSCTQTCVHVKSNIFCNVTPLNFFQMHVVTSNKILLV
jgi:hypothetical protein